MSVTDLVLDNRSAPAGGAAAAEKPRGGRREARAPAGGAAAAETPRGGRREARAPAGGAAAGRSRVPRTAAAR
jgi:hypothetical protein